jgi:hypothetical protein
MPNYVKLVMPCSVTPEDELEVRAYPDGAFELGYKDSDVDQTALFCMTREDFLRFCLWGLDCLEKKVGGT